MSVLAANDTIRNAVKPVGEIIPVLYVKENVELSEDYYVDFEIDSNYVVTGLEVTKVVAALGAADQVVVTVSKISSGKDAIATATVISEATLAASTSKGERVLAGAPYAAGSYLFASADPLDPLTKVAATAPAAADGLTKQRIRLAIAFTAGLATTKSPSVFVKVELARFSDIITFDELASMPRTYGKNT